MALSGFIFPMNKKTINTANATASATQPPRLKVINIPVPEHRSEMAARVCSFLFSDFSISPMVIKKIADKNAEKILGSVMIPQHLVLNNSFEAGSSHVGGICGASMYSQIAIIP